MGHYYDAWITMSNKIISEYDRVGRLPAKPPKWASRALGAMRTINATLKHQETRFIQFDTEQAEILLNSGTAPEPKGLPFPVFALEFTESFMVTDAQLLSEDGSTIDNSFLMGALITDKTMNKAVIVNDPGDMIGVMLMLNDRPHVAFLDSWVSFGMSISTGDIYYTAYFLRNYTDQDVPDDVPENHFLKLNEESKGIAYTEFASLIRWLLSYMTGGVRGINLEPVRLPRAERRRYEKNRETPQQWYRMKVDGKYLNAGDEEGTRKSGSHSYKYDVRGHIRRGRYRLKDGTHREVLQFIPAHQRGLKNEKYIPKVTDFQVTDKLEIPG